MTDEIVSGLRMGAKLWEQSADEMPRMTGHSRWLMTAAADEIEKLRAALKPFAEQAAFYVTSADGAIIYARVASSGATANFCMVGDLRAAAAALYIQQRLEPK